MADSPLFVIDDVHVSTRLIGSEDAEESAVEILSGVSFIVDRGEIHVLIGPDGSGTSDLAAALMGSPYYDITSGRILFRGDDITGWAVDVRGKAGMFLAFRDPQEIGGVSVLNFLRRALSARKGVEMSVPELRVSLVEWMDKLSMDASFMERHLNNGLSAGEKSRNEILQMAVLAPEMAILDETAADLDPSALQAVAEGVHAIKSERPEMATLAITHSHDLLNHLKPDFVHILIDGRIIASGGMELAAQLESEGYDSFT